MENSCRECRKFGAKLFLKGERCLSPKCAYTRRSYRPGSHGVSAKPRRKTEYGIQLEEKQKAKTTYGLREKQFHRFYLKALRAKQGSGEELLRLLELRFDNIVYRLGWANSRPQARQIVLHRKIKVNNRIVNIPSAILKTNDVITPVKSEQIKPQKVTLPSWLKLDSKLLKAEVKGLPSRSDIETGIDEQLIVEFYSR